MGLFSAIVGTAVEVVKLPLSVAADIVTGGGDYIDGGKTFTEKNVEAIKKEAEKADD